MDAIKLRPCRLRLCAHLINGLFDADEPRFCGPHALSLLLIEVLDLSLELPELGIGTLELLNHPCKLFGVAPNGGFS